MNFMKIPVKSHEHFSQENNFPEKCSITMFFVPFYQADKGANEFILHNAMVQVLTSYLLY